MTTTRRLLNSRLNGGYVISIFDDGTKLRSQAYPVPPIFPESIDLKITDYCDAGCPWCHERSTRRGTHADLEKVRAFVEQLPAGTELAIGGGNPLSHPEFEEILSICVDNGVIANVTVNERHLEAEESRLESLMERRRIFGLGLSKSAYPCGLFGSRLIRHPRTVVHIINGITNVRDTLRMVNEWRVSRVLVLGYKSFGLGPTYQERYPHRIATNLSEWRMQVGRVLGSGALVSFDNLAIEQLMIRQRVSPALWAERYMGDDGTFTMYVDLVRNEFARTSTEERIPMRDLNIKEAFGLVRRAA